MEKSEKSDFIKLQILQYRVTEHQLAEIWKKLRENDLEPILIKGWAASKFYPNFYERHIGDFDIAVSPESYPRAVDVIKREQLLKVDLHKGLRHLDTVSWGDLFENSIELECEKVRIRVLRPEDHLRVLAVHWLTDGGEYFEKLWDIVYLIENNPKEFDWDRCLGVVSQNRQRWIIVTVGLAHKYLGLSLDGLTFAERAKDLPVWMIKFLEREWREGYRLLSLQTVIKDKKEFWKQIKKRLPPNPIQAAIDVEGDLDSGRGVRFWYQVKSIFKRILPSIKRFRGEFGK